MASRVAMMALLAVLAAGLESDMWGPTYGVKAYDAVEKALEKVLSVHMSPEQSTKAKHVADDVRKAIAAVETSSNMTKVQRKAKIGAAVKELLDLETDMKRVAEGMLSGGRAGLNEKMEKLQKELAEKKEELAKDSAMIKMMTLQKELAEKKLELQKLIEKKTQGAASKKADAEDAKQESALVTKLLKETGTLAKVAGKTELPASLKAALTEVQTRSKKESDALERMDSANKKAMAELDAQMKKAGGGKSTIRAFKKEEHRQYMKARAMKQAQVTELKSVEQSIEQHDAKRLQSTLAEMQQQTKARAAQSGNFLY